MILTWNDPYIGIFDLERLELSQEIEVPDSTNQIAISDDKNTLLAAMDSPQIAIVDLRNNKTMGQLEGHIKGNFAIKFIDEY